QGRRARRLERRRRHGRESAPPRGARGGTDAPRLRRDPRRHPRESHGRYVSQRYPRDRALTRVALGGAWEQNGDEEDELMRVDQLMTRNPKTCGPHDTLEQAAAIMWD